MDLVIRLIKFSLLIALAVAVLDASGLSPENSYIFILGLFKSYSGFLLHPIALILYAFFGIGILSRFVRR